MGALSHIQDKEAAQIGRGLTLTVVVVVVSGSSICAVVVVVCIKQSLHQSCTCEHLLRIASCLKLAYISVKLGMDT